MRYTKHELSLLAKQTSNYFDREGALVMKEKQDGFFRRCEGISIRWFRLRGNLLFYLKGPEPWDEPAGLIVLGHHEVKVLPQTDSNSQWPFEIFVENGMSYKLSAFFESERALWIKAIKIDPYSLICSQVAELKQKINKIRPVIDVASYRLQKAIVTDMNEVPLCEFAVSCDNILCDAYGKPPSTFVVVYVRRQNGLCIQYGQTEVIERCSNPSFSKTILLRPSDELSREDMVRLVVYDMREAVSETSVAIGFTTLKLSTIQEAQRLRVPFTSKHKNVGFITINSWSLEPAYIGTSPSNTNDKHSVDIPQKISHRRSHSLPLKLGLKLKFPSYGVLLKQNFVNSHQSTFRFNSGLGGEITVHEIMAEPKICFRLPLQLLNIYINREMELLQDLFSVSKLSGHWKMKQTELAQTHVSLLKHYHQAKASLESMKNLYFKASPRKGERNLDFVPVNLHLQRMWTHNDTLNKTGFHDIITVGAFTVHTSKSDQTGGLIRLIQRIKDMESEKATFSSTNESKVQINYENVLTARILKEDMCYIMNDIFKMLEKKHHEKANKLLQELKRKVKMLVSLWSPTVVEEALSYIGWPQNVGEQLDIQPKGNIDAILEHLGLEAMNAEYDFFYPPSNSSSFTEIPSISSSVPNMCPIDCSGSFSLSNKLDSNHDYFKNGPSRSSFNESHKSIRSIFRPKMNDTQSFSLDLNSRGSEDVCGPIEHTSRSLIDSISWKRKSSETRSPVVLTSARLDSVTRQNNLTYLKSIGLKVEETAALLAERVTKIIHNEVNDVAEELARVSSTMGRLKDSCQSMWCWYSASHAAARIRSADSRLSQHNVALQMRRDICFSQALTALTTGLLCWLHSVPTDVVHRVLSSELGPLCCFEGLLSLYSKEKSMWGDMVVAIEDLQTAQFTLLKATRSLNYPVMEGSRDSLIIRIPVSDSLYSKFTSKEHKNFTITPVFFNIGINNHATIAEALGETVPQAQSNCDNMDRLCKYYHKYCKVFPIDHTNNNRGSSRTKPLDEIMESLRVAVHKKVPKNVDVLHFAALATRLMNGIRFTSCKSAKDRTGMAVTLEQCSILASEYHLADHEMKKALDILRSEGCRRANVKKNIGIAKYAFTQKQMLALPKLYQPPPGTYGDTET